MALFLPGCLLFNFPLALFTGTTRTLGIPLIRFYVFATWAMIIGSMALISR